ncbi:hypothetical protein D770_05055 [Flammeovirgaceae bacterium 311]|nr:hypothetical protein D770_05055 [Flammeovirgaceae bacterium 311]
MNNRILIPYSKVKIGLALLGCLAFIALSTCILLDDEGFTSIMFKSEVLNKVIAGIAILFFGAILVTIPIKLSSNSVGVIIDDNGITDNSNFSSIGLIEWKDIKGVRTRQVEKTKFLLVYTNSPKKYIDKAESGFKRRLLTANNKMNGTPLSITSTILSMKFSQLEKIVAEAYKKNKNIHQQQNKASSPSSFSH